MEVDRQLVLDLLARDGDTQVLDVARRTLPPQVDPAAHEAQLRALGLDPAEVLRYAGIDPDAVSAGG